MAIAPNVLDGFVAESNTNSIESFSLLLSVSVIVAIKCFQLLSLLCPRT